MRKSVFMFIFLFLFNTTAVAEVRPVRKALSDGVKVVATLPWIGSIINDIGKEKVEVTVLVKSNQDPHQIEAKPGMILQTRKADILAYNGLDLEIGYLPVLIESSRNPKIQAGKPGNLDCSQYVTPIEKSLSADRSMGDVHPFGNPHYHLSPKNILKAAEGISERLSAIDPANADFYRANLVSFREKLKEKQKLWSIKQLKGKRVVAYHKMFEYLAAEFGFEIIGYLEPKPGIPPSAGHIEKLIGIMQKAKPEAILTTAYYGRKEAQFISQKTGVSVITVPHDVGAAEKAKDWFTLMDHVLATLE